MSIKNLNERINVKNGYLTVINGKQCIQYRYKFKYRVNKTDFNELLDFYNNLSFFIVRLPHLGIRSKIEKNIIPIINSFNSCVRTFVCLSVRSDFLKNCLKVLKT